MTVIKEKIGDGYIDEEGDLKPYADVQPDLDYPFTDNASIAQGRANLQASRDNLKHDEQLEIEASVDARLMRERLLAEHALSVAGPHTLIGEHKETGLQLLDAVSDMSMYEGGEKGGYKTRDFKNRYEMKAPDVESGARRNHQILVRKTFPELLKASQLIESGFTEYDVSDMVNKARIKMKRKYGGPENERARSKMRARLKSH